MDALVAALTALAAVAGIVQTVVTLVERSERKRLNQKEYYPHRYSNSRPSWRPPLKIEKKGREAIGQADLSAHTTVDDPATAQTNQDIPFSETGCADTTDFAATTRSSLAYLFGFIGAIVYWKNRSEKVRFHAAQSLWIDLLAVTYFIIALTLTVIYIGFRYPGPGPVEIGPNDPVMWAWVLTTLFGPPALHCLFAILVVAGKNPRLPLVWKIAATIANRDAKPSAPPIGEPPRWKGDTIEKPAIDVVAIQNHSIGSHDPGGFNQGHLDMDDFAGTWRSSLAYILGFLGALVFWKDPRPRVRFHAAQSLWIGLLAIAYFVTGLLAVGIYVAIRYNDPEVQAPISDPIVLIYMLTSLPGSPIIFLTWSALTLSGRNPRFPFAWRIATTVALRRDHDADVTEQVREHRNSGQPT